MAPEDRKTVTWDTDIMESLRIAEEAFNKAKDENYLLIADTDKPEQMRKFDPTVQHIVAMRAMAGGC